MKNLLKNAILKKILIVFITIIMTSNFIMPNYVHAIDLAKEGKKLVGGFFYLLAYIGDAGISLMQKMAKGTWDIDSNGTYKIKYSPGMIFSDNVALLKINFVTAEESDKDTTPLNSDADNETSMKDILERLGKKVKEGKVTKEYVGKFTGKGNTLSFESDNFSKEDLNLTIKSDGKIHIGDYFLEIRKGAGAANNFVGITNSIVEDVLNFASYGKGYIMWTYDNYIYILEEDVSISDSEGIILGGFGSDVNDSVYRYNLSSISGENVTVESTAYQLKSTIALWYNALRTIALVGLLSVLVYIGIKIIISSSSAQDKAKYKNMLKDWLVALCILFVLHYIMAFLLDFNSILNNIMVSNVIEETTEPGATEEVRVDKLMSEVRNKIGDYENDGVSGFDVVGYTIMYLALVILTGIFTFQYLKRVVFMAFLTMVAPMIALTYPLDKIKDGKAQAFSYWLREYIFNCLIQPVHLLLYAVFISSAMEFAQENILYAVVALGFMVPAEKFIKEMFGMKSSSPVSTLGAAAGGAMVMSMLQKMKGKPPKGGAEVAGAGASSKQNGVRPANSAGSSGNNNQVGNGAEPLSNAQAGANTGSQTNRRARNNANSQGNNQAGRNAASQGNNQAGNNAEPLSNAQAGANTGSQTNRRARNNASSQVNNQTGIAKNPIKGVAKVASSAAKFTGRKTAAIGGGLAAGTIGFAAGVASGDFGKALQYAGIGAMTGYVGADNLAQNVTQGISNAPKNLKNAVNKVSDIYHEGALGYEANQQRKFDREFFGSDGYKLIDNDAGIKAFAESRGMSVKDLTQEYLNNGVTDAGKIREALQSGVSGNDYKAFTDAGVSSAKDIAKLNSVGIKAEDMSEFKDAGITSASKIAKVKSKHKNISNGHLASMFKVAKNASPELLDNKDNFIKYAKRFGIEEKEAEEMFNKIGDFL